MDNQLQELRQKINQSIVALAMQDDGPEEERLQVLLNVINAGSASYEVMQRAFELTQRSVPNEEVGRKLDYLLDILHGIDAQLAADGPEGSEISQS